MKRFEFFTVNIGGPEIRREELEGEMHLVVPAVILTEGVHNGSKGPIYYPKEENARNPSAWDHMPVVVYHPKKNGKPTTARQPSVLNTRKIGIILNTESEDGAKVKTEAWLNEKRLKKVDKRILEKLEKKQKVEVSTGLFMDLEEEAGTWGKESYKLRATNYQPDHLAVLPDQIGACSIADGAGLLANADSEEPEGVQFVMLRSAQEALKAVGGSFAENELSFDGIRRQICDALASAYGQPGKYWGGYVNEVYKDRVIYYAEDGKTYMVSYTVKDDAVKLGDDETEVRRVVEYKAVENDESYTANESGELISNHDGGSDMAKNKELVSKLIENGLIDESQRAEYEKLDEKILTGIKIPAKPAKPAKGKKKVEDDEEEVANEEEEDEEEVVPAKKKAKAAKAGKVENSEEMSEKEFWEKAPKGLRNQFARLAKQEKTRKKAIIKDLLANESVPFSEEYLQERDLEELEGLALMASKTKGPDDDDDDDDDTDDENGIFRNGHGPNYGAAAGGVAVNRRGKKTAVEDDEDDEPLVMPTINFGGKKRKDDDEE